MYDIAIIGAGTSGLMASIAATNYGANTLIIEKNKIVGKKLRLTGGGRCNVTNSQSIEHIINHIPGNGKFLYSTFSQFDNQDIIDFFNNHDTPLKEEDHGRMFPKSNKSTDIVNTLYNIAQRQEATFKLQETVKKISFYNDIFTITTDNQQYQARKIIISTGGKTYQYTGSTGDGYKFAKKFGHTITPLYPTECALKSHDSIITNKELQGLSFKDIEVTVIGNKKSQIKHRHDLLFTHFGLSGPAILRSSGVVWQLLNKKQKVQIAINFAPNQTSNNLKDTLQRLAKQYPEKQISSLLSNILPERLAKIIIKQANIKTTSKCKQLTVSHYENIINHIQQFTININATIPLDKAFVTGGGIALKEVNPKTLESKLQPNLYFTGEVLDINGYTGGYNITAALCTGYSAGSNAAMSLWT